MLAPDWTWLTAVPVVLATVVILWAPGGVLALGLGSGRWPALALAPLFTTGLVAVGGIITALVGATWGIAAALFWLLLVPGVVLAARFLLERTGRRPWRLGAPEVRVWEVVTGLVISTAVATWVFYEGTVQPGNIPQQSDQIFHIGLVRNMLDAGNISSLTANGFNQPDTPSFYPSAFHGVVGTIALFTGAPIVVVENVLLLVSCALIFPVGLMFLLNTLIANDRRLVLLTGVLALTLTAAPWRVMIWGALWTQVYGSVFIPALIAVYGWGLVQVLRGQNWGSAALLFAVSVPSVGLAHTNAVLGAAAAALLFSVAASLGYALKEPRRPLRWVPLVGFTLVSIGGPAVGAMLAPEDLVRISTWDRPDIQNAIRLVTLWAERGNITQFASIGIFLLALVGLGFCVWRGRHWWLAAVAVIFVAMASITDAMGSWLVWPLTWPWYTWTYRVQGVGDIYVIALAIIGASTLLAVGDRLRSSSRTWLATAWTSAVAVGLLAILLVQTVTNAAAVKVEYTKDGHVAWISREKANALLELSREMPDDAVVIANPWRGGMYLYVLAPQRTAIATDKTNGRDITTLSQGLADMTTDPEVCAAVQRSGATYALTGGTTAPGTKETDPKYGGIDAISEAGGFRQVAQSGPYTLWSLPACSVA